MSQQYKPSQKTPVTERDRELWDMPSIQSQMPIVFTDSTRYDTLDATCGGCGTTILRSNVHGAVKRILHSTATVEAVGVCHSCKLFTRIDYRLHEDMTVTGLRHGRWARWGPQRSFIEKLKALFFKGSL
jgi:hypothetical protein